MKPSGSLPSNLSVNHLEAVSVNGDFKRKIKTVPHLRQTRGMALIVDQLRSISQSEAYDH